MDLNWETWIFRGQVGRMMHSKQTDCDRTNIGCAWEIEDFLFGKVLICLNMESTACHELNCVFQKGGLNMFKFMDLHL